MKEPSMEAANVILLLTSCIRPNPHTIHLARMDPELRLQDALAAFSRFMSAKGIRDVVFCDNSGYDLSELQRIPRNGKLVEFLSYIEEPYDPALGKGVGEARIIKYVLENSKIISSSNGLIMKVSGRYYLRNLDEYLSFIKRHPDRNVFVKLRRELTFAESRVFVASKDFLRHYFLVFANRINDSEAYYFEHALADAVHLYMSQNRDFKYSHIEPQIVGVYATTDQAYGGFWKRRLKSYIHEVCYAVLSR